MNKQEFRESQPLPKKPCTTLTLNFNFLIFNSHSYLHPKTFASAENINYNCLWFRMETELKFFKLYFIPLHKFPFEVGITRTSKPPAKDFIGCKIQLIDFRSLTRDSIFIIIFF